MGLLFNRSIAVTFAKKGQAGTRVTDLYITFSGEKSSESKPDKFKITIYNLNKNSRATLENEKNLVLLLEAGYNPNRERVDIGKLGTLFVGNITKAVNQRTLNEWVTTIECGDGQVAFSKSINKTLAAGATTKTVVETLANEMKIGLGTVKGVVEDVFQKGITLSGKASEKMDTVIKKMGLEWGIQDEKLQITPPLVPSSTVAIVLNKNSGLLEAPAKRKNGINFKSLLRVELKPGISVKVESESTNGFFKIRKSLYDGNNRSGEFSVKCEAAEISADADKTSSQKLNITKGESSF